jgi:mRNA interferase RelE/StbE
MWKTEYKKTFLKELSKLPAGTRTRIEKIVFEELICENPFKLGYTEKLKGYEDKYKIRVGDYTG